MNEEIIEKFLQKLNEEDPPHVLALVGVYSASKWIKKLGIRDRRIIYDYMSNQLEQKGELLIKESIIMVLQNVGGDDSINILDKVICEGEDKHGKYIISIAKGAREFLSSYSKQEFMTELMAIVDDINKEIVRRKNGIIGEGTIEELNSILNELEKLRSKVINNKIKNRKKQLYLEYLINSIFEFKSPLRRKIDKLISNYQNRL